MEAPPARQPDEIEPQDTADDAPEPTAVQQREAEMATLLAGHRSGASWFFWVAALSLINSLLAFFGAEMRFIFGLGITQAIDALGEVVGGGDGLAKGIAFGASLAVAGVVALFGIAAIKRMHAVYILGIVLYTLDGLLTLVFQDWLGAGFHVFVLYGLIRGLVASRKLRRLEEELAPVIGAPIIPR